MRAILAAAVIATAAPASAQSVQERLPACLSCHGEKGQSANPDVPSLGAQQKDYLVVQLYMFREKLRTVDVMNEATKGLSDGELQTIAERVAALPPPVPLSNPSDSARMERGNNLASVNHCNSCHTPNFAGQDQVPRISGQREEYLLRTLREYKSGVRRGYDPMMASVVATLQDQDFADLAYYLARQK